MEDALRALKRQGAVLIDPAVIPTLGRFGGSEVTVFMYELKADLNAYLERLGPGAPVHSLKEIIEFNKQNSKKEMPYFGQDLFLRAEEKGPLTSDEYLEAVEKNHRLSRKEGIDAVMDKNKLDALVAPTAGPAWVTDLVYGGGGRGGSSSAAAVAGYPNITVPAGFVFGLPVGISFFGRAWSEPTLLKLAYAFEQATKAPEAAALPADDRFAGVIVGNVPSEEVARLITAYRATSYFVDGPGGRFAVRVGQPSPEADALAAAHGAAVWAYVTAYNPGSVAASPERNEKKQWELEQVIVQMGYRFCRGEGAADDGSWPPEPSLLVLDADEAAAKALARRSARPRSSAAGGARPRGWCGPGKDEKGPCGGSRRLDPLAQLAERLALDLADALARQAEAVADLLQRHRILAVQAEAQPQHGRLALVHLVQQRQDVVQVVGVRHLGVRRLGAHVGEHFFERPAVVGLVGLRRRVVNADGLADDRQLLFRQMEVGGDLFLRRRAAQLLL